MRRKPLFLGAALTTVAAFSVLLGVSLSTSLFSADESRTQVETLDIVHTEPQDILAASDVIVIGIYKSERMEMVRDNAIDTAEKAGHEDLVRLFEIKDVIRGDDVAVGSLLDARVTTKVWLPKALGGSTSPMFTYRDDRRLIAGRPYVIFLGKFLDQKGDPYYGSFGSADIAALNGNGGLSFVVASGYLDILARNGFNRALPQAFVGLTRASLAEMVARSDVERAEAAARPGRGIQLSPIEKGLQRFLDEVPNLRSAQEAEALAASLGLSGPRPPDAGLCTKLESHLRQARGIEANLRCDSP